MTWRKREREKQRKKSETVCSYQRVTDDPLKQNIANKITI